MCACVCIYIYKYIYILYNIYNTYIIHICYCLRISQSVNHAASQSVDPFILGKAESSFSLRQRQLILAGWRVKL